MGNNFKKQEKKKSEIGIKKFKINRIIGLGGSGTVWEVEHKTSKKLYAMKQMNKTKIVSRREINSVFTEKKFLSLIKHPFIVKMQYAFQDRQNLYLITDLMSGGNLRYWIHNHKYFTEKQIKFFAACIITGLEYLHVNHIVHRDIKPENLVFDSKGYLKITDLGSAREYTLDNKEGGTGTLGYIAPEIMNFKHGRPESDYFSLGVILFECIVGHRPYRGKNIRGMKEMILAKEVELTRNCTPKGWSMEAADFVNKCLERNPECRLGAHGCQELKNHAWLRDFDWRSLFEKKLKAPLVPEKEDNFDDYLFLRRESEYEEQLADESVQAIFAGYFYDKRLQEKKNQESTK